MCMSELLCVPFGKKCLLVLERLNWQGRNCFFPFQPRTAFHFKQRENESVYQERIRGVPMWTSFHFREIPVLVFLSSQAHLLHFAYKSWPVAFSGLCIGEIGQRPGNPFQGITQACMKICSCTLRQCVSIWTMRKSCKWITLIV